MFECFNCGEKAVLWMNDWSFEDYGMEGEGLIHVLRCTNCGARITYEVPDRCNGDVDCHEGCSGEAACL